MRKTVVARLDLGFTRVAGYLLFDPVSKEFQETTPKVVEKMVAARAVNGLIIEADGELVPDKNGWNIGNIKIRSGVGNYRDLNTVDPKGDTVYHVVRALKLDDTQTIYEVVNNKCARVFYSENQLRALAQFSWIGGVRITDEVVELCDGVIRDSVKDKNFIELGNSVYSVNGKSAVEIKTEQAPKTELEKLFDDAALDSGFKEMPDEITPNTPDDMPSAEAGETPTDINDENIEEKLKELFGNPYSESVSEKETEETDNTNMTSEESVTAEVGEPEAVKDEVSETKETKKQKNHGKKHH